MITKYRSAHTPKVSFPKPSPCAPFKLLTFNAHPRLLSPPGTLSFSKGPRDSDTEDQGLRASGPGWDSRPGALAREARTTPKSPGRWQRREEKWKEREDQGTKRN